MENRGASCTILGLDLGANSVGWALLSAVPDRKGARLEPTGLVACGARVFEAGVEGNLESGREESRGVSRRQARAARRLLDRRARRCDKLFRLLQGAGLLPPGGPTPPDAPRAAAQRRELRAARSKARNALLTELDAALLDALTDKLRAEGADEQSLALLPHTLPYRLRARALDHPLDPHELGRALYHLGQRRGFLSNRKAPPKDKKEEGAVKEGISELRKAMGRQTLGQHFAGLDPEQRRIRGRWTARDMYEDEFDRIWQAQAPHHPAILSDGLKKRLHRAIFFQRPLKIRKEFIGACPHEPDRKRAPIALLAAQRFRLLQQVNHTRVQMPEGTVRELADAERTTLVNALDAGGDLTFSRAKKLLGIHPHATFNFEEGEEKRFVGNRTAAKLAKVFGDRWFDLSPEQQDQVVEDLRSIQKEATLIRRAKTAWHLDQQAAAELGEVSLEDGYCRLSRQALARLLPHMEKGCAYQEAVGEVYGHAPDATVVDLLPPVAHALAELRNPAVARVLTELRKVVNAIVRTYGRPHTIRIELARDLRRSRRQRQEATKKNRRIERDREIARELIQAETPIAEPKSSDIQKALLWQECGGICPYTGQPIPFAALFGPHPQFDVEHIIPFSRSLDNSFLNKTLCEIEENRARKRNRTPHEAYAGDPDRWGVILTRVKHFHGTAAREKLRRFKIEDPDFDGFVSQQLNDTRYASRLAMKYLGLLYGEQALSRVQASRGGVTGFLRDELELNALLGDGPGKSRADHRHHAVDAVAIALTERATVKMLSDAAEQAHRHGRSRFAPVDPPWPAFLDDARAAIHSAVVSRRVSRKVAGPMHQDTVYSPLKTDPDGRQCVHVRKPLDKLSAKEVGRIVDPAVRQAVQEKLAERGGPPKEAFADEGNSPCLTTKDGRAVPIRSVRIRAYERTFELRSAFDARRVQTKENHHVELIEVEGRRGKTTWKGVVVSQYEAIQRLRRNESIVRRDHGPGRRFLFSLAKGEALCLEAEDAQPDVFTVVRIWPTERGARFALRRHNEAPTPGKLKLLWKSDTTLQSLGAQKVLVDPLGRIRRVGRD